MSEPTKFEKFRHITLYKIARMIVPVVLRKYHFTTDKIPKTKENYIVIANHLTEVDMLMVGLACPQHMYFVAGEHLLRTRFGKFIKWSQNPIFEAKGASSMRTVIEIVKRVKNGNNIMIFPEGSRSFNGETVLQPDTIAKLVKRCGCGLVTYHIEGGYFVAPRWAYNFRTGPMKGKIAKYRTAQEVAEMSNKELADAINREIYENAYVTQRKKQYSYKGKNLAEGIENYLIVCTECGQFDSLTSEGNTFCCKSCGLSGTYTEKGFLEGEKLRFDSVYDWGKWSENKIEAYIESMLETNWVCFSEDDISVFEITDKYNRKELYSGRMDGYIDHITAGEYVFSFGDISAMSMLYYGKTLLFTCGNRYYGITGKGFHALKYQKLYENYRKGNVKDDTRTAEEIKR